MFRRIITSVPAARITAPATTRTSVLAGNKRNYHEKDITPSPSSPAINTNISIHSSTTTPQPRNVGSMPKSDMDVGTGLVGAPACGDVMKLQIRVDSATNTISDVKFKTFGCGSAIASSSYLTELNTEIAKELCLPPVKLHCSMLAEDAIKSAIKDYQTKTKRGRLRWGRG
ncbi:hypothetical protein BDD12DRAFT_824594 [Trichophaea hybrida]|nr:hypothetical protein BDD12DRAFT_824594 [Trichophaea hybrida]